MSNPETPKTGSDRLVSASACVVERIAAVLAEHRASDGFEECSCGYGPDSFVFSERRSLHLQHLASVVAALPDIAVMELPEGENNWQITDWDGGRVSLCYGVDTVRCYLPNPELEVGEAEQLGIALIAASRYLAAALAAGGQA